jgi:hypothetical protein
LIKLQWQCSGLCSGGMRLFLVSERSRTEAIPHWNIQNNTAFCPAVAPCDSAQSPDREIVLHAFQFYAALSHVHVRREDPGMLRQCADRIRLPLSPGDMQVHSTPEFSEKGLVPETKNEITLTLVQT